MKRLIFVSILLILSFKSQSVLAIASCPPPIPVCFDPQKWDETACECVGDPTTALPISWTWGLAEANATTQAPTTAAAIKEVKPLCPINDCDNPLQFWDVNQCRCVCKQIPYCQKPPFVLNLDTCLCECADPVICSSVQVLNKTTCKCQCKNDCNAGKNCVEPQLWNNKACRCDCDNSFYSSYCPSYKYKDYDSCSCKCKEQRQICCKPKIWNKESCQCMCPKVEICPSNKYWNKDLCQCVCKSMQKCPLPRIWNEEKCMCQCNIECAPNYILNPSTCKCVCNTKLAKECFLKPNHYWDQASCSCKCKPIDCKTGYVQNPDSCLCECDKLSGKSNCEAGTFDSKSCSCSCPAKLDCPTNFVADTSRCACKCDDSAGIACAGNWNPVTCVCSWGTKIPCSGSQCLV